MTILHISKLNNYLTNLISSKLGVYWDKSWAALINNVLPIELGVGIGFGLGITDMQYP